MNLKLKNMKTLANLLIIMLLVCSCDETNQSAAASLTNIDSTSNSYSLFSFDSYNYSTHRSYASKSTEQLIQIDGFCYYLNSENDANSGKFNNEIITDGDNIQVPSGKFYVNIFDDKGYKVYTLTFFTYNGIDYVSDPDSWTLSNKKFEDFGLTKIGSSKINNENLIKDIKSGKTFEIIRDYTETFRKNNSPIYTEKFGSSLLKDFNWIWKNYNIISKTAAVPSILGNFNEIIITCDKSEFNKIVRNNTIHRDFQDAGRLYNEMLNDVKDDNKTYSNKHLVNPNLRNNIIHNLR